MLTSNISHTLMEEDSMRRLSIGCYTPFSSTHRQRRSRSTSGVHQDILNVSPRLFQHSPTVHLDRRIDEQNSLCLQEIASGCSSTISRSTEVPMHKPAAELLKEISALELEIINLERYLLSLYRTAFDQYLASSPTIAGHGSRSSLERQSGLNVEDANVRIAHRTPPAISSDQQVDQKKRSRSHENIEKKRAKDCKTKNSPHDLAASSENCASLSLNQNPNDDLPKVAFGHRSLADHLGASLMDHVPEIPCRLSEDIVKCISAVYCKLANPLGQPMDLIASPSPSASSSSTFSPQDPYDNWSPRCHYQATASPSLFEELKDNSPYSNLVEIPRISIDGNRFGFASKMLNLFRSLIRRLETVDPKKMEHEAQLAFWINIHNALVMHAFLAYGLHQNQMKSTYSILKAAYNVGGHSINACDIQSSILGCQPHRPSLWLHTLFAPKKFTRGMDKHRYALDRPEPLAHFALCLGAHSDPIVRVYKAKNIFPELKIAREEFIQANVSVYKEKKVILPKMLYSYAKDASLELSDLVEMVGDCMPGPQQKFIQRCLKGKLDKCVEWSSYKSAFRYLVHRDLANHSNRISVSL